MTVGTRVLSGHPRSRFLLGGLLAMAAAVHFARIGSLPRVDAAACAGLGIVYAVLVFVVVLGERWGYLAAAVFPLIAQLLGDFQSFAAVGDPIAASDPVVDLVIVPVAVFVLRATAVRVRSSEGDAPPRRGGPTRPFGEPGAVRTDAAPSRFAAVSRPRSHELLTLPDSACCRSIPSTLGGKDVADGRRR